ncbi:MAG: alcohol dehydrogenase catalytic domain-containing protein, partial [Acidimicrobiia bacterium]|nr:alcohol dehydrogenase catalytic domain-containing protein [Acidimicrobiia bacterium]
MRAAICRSHGTRLSIEEIDVAPPGPDHVRVDVHVCAICHSDITYIDGGWGGPTPAIYGHEAAGVVESIGKGVSGIEPGDR